MEFSSNGFENATNMPVWQINLSKIHGEDRKYWRGQEEVTNKPDSTVIWNRVFCYINFKFNLISPAH